MEIIRLIHDEEHKHELFGYIGEFAASAKVRDTLGGNISSELNQIWFIALDVTTQHPLDFVLWQGARSAESVAYGLYVRIRASQQRSQRAKDGGC